MKVGLLAAFFAILACAAPIASASASRRAVAFTSSRVSVAVGAAVLPISLHSYSTPKENSTLSTVKDTADTAKSIAEIIGLVVGGCWTWLLFVKNRQDYPRAKVTHTISRFALPNGSRLLRVKCTVTNIGPVFLRLDSTFTWVQQMLPLPTDFQTALDAKKDPLAALGPSDSEYGWPVVAERKCDWKASPREVEPGEDDAMQFDFVVDSEAQLVEIYSYFKNERKKREIGWSETTIYDLVAGKVLAEPLGALDATPNPAPAAKQVTA
jgi:hypothetical protein